MTWVHIPHDPGRGWGREARATWSKTGRVLLSEDGTGVSLRGDGSALFPKVDGQEMRNPRASDDIYRLIGFLATKVI